MYVSIDESRGDTAILTLNTRRQSRAFKQALLLMVHAPSAQSIALDIEEFVAIDRTLADVNGTPAGPDPETGGFTPTNYELGYITVEILP
jgi:hypothetical protein